MRNILDKECVRERKWTPPFLELSQYRQSRKGLPKAYWSAIMTPRPLLLIEKARISLEIYNPHMCAR